MTLFNVFLYLRYRVSYRDLEEFMQERGVDVDHATFSRWVIKISTLIVVQAKKRVRCCHVNGPEVAGSLIRA
jgi:putative transposase